MSSVKQFERNLAYGEEGEKIVAEKLIENNFPVIPLYQYKKIDEAPALFLASKNIILPDLQVFDEQDNLMWVEVKRKRQWVSYTGELETGINENHFKHYEKIEKLTGAPVYIFFIHEVKKPLGIFYISLKKAGKVKRYWNGCTPSGKFIEKPMLFFRKIHLEEYKGGQQ